MTSTTPSSSQIAPDSRQFASIRGSNRPPRPDDRLGNLPEEDQDQILSWVQDAGLRPAVKIIAKPRPEGLGLKIHYNSLRHFYHKHTRPNSELDPEQLAAIPDLSKDPVFAEICHKLEEEILVGLDCAEGRDETMRLLSIYLRYRALLQKSIGRRDRGRFRPQLQPFPEPVAEPTAPQPPSTNNETPETRNLSSSSLEQHFSTTEQDSVASQSPPDTSMASVNDQDSRAFASIRGSASSSPEQHFSATAQDFPKPENSQNHSPLRLAARTFPIK